MRRAFAIDGARYDADALSVEGQALVERLRFAQVQQQILCKQQALLNKAKNAYIADLRDEIVQGRTGNDLSDLFSAD